MGVQHFGMDVAFVADGRRWQALMIFAMRLSRTRNDHCFPLLPVKRKRTSFSSTATCRFLISQARRSSVASLGSTIACALTAESSNKTEALHLPSQTNLLERLNKEGDAHARRPWSGFFLSFRCRTRATSGAWPFFV